MQQAIEVRDLCKSYADFALRDVSFSLPAGGIMGFVGENGAGKTTTIKAMLGIINSESGTVSLLGRDALAETRAAHEHIGVVFEECMFYEVLRLKDIDRIMSRVYEKWDSALFARLFRHFKLPEQKALKDFSRGMRMKVSISAALAHHPRLLILDEATSGFDPIARDELLEMFLDFIQDEEHAIFFSSHITSDLDRIADYITFIHEGEILFCEDKNCLLEETVLIRAREAEFAALEPSRILRWRKNDFGYEALVQGHNGFGADCVAERPSIEQIMLLYVRGHKTGGEGQ